MFVLTLCCCRVISSALDFNVSELEQLQDAEDEPSAVPKPDSTNILSFIANMQLQLEQSSRLLMSIVADNSTSLPSAKRHRIDVALPLASLNATSPASQNANTDAAQTANFGPAQTGTSSTA